MFFCSKLSIKINHLTAIIIQARSGSTRLPNKMNLNFYNEDSILDIIVSRIKKAFPDLLIVLATTSNDKDDALVERVSKHQIEVFRGCEDDVLDRFITAAEFYKVHKIIRICADNPFIDMTSLKELINQFECSNADYISYQTKTGVPTVKTHYGFWAEAVTLKALKKVKDLTDDYFYHEHVTNYIYGNPDIFKIEFIPIPDYLNSTEIRLTIDTKVDFNTAKEVYDYVLKEKKLNIKHIYDAVLSRDKWLKSMSEQINEQKK